MYVYIFSVSNSGYYDAHNTNSSSFTGLQAVLSMTMRTCNVRRFAVSNINMAFDQTTYMSSENLGFCEGNCTSEHAVDGDRGTSMLRCSLTGPEEKAWWAVKLLLSDAKIAKVVVTNGGAYGRKELHLAICLSRMRHRDDCNTSTNSISKIGYDQLNNVFMFM